MEKRNNYLNSNTNNSNFSQGIQNKPKQGPIKVHNDEKNNLSIIKYFLK
jgi:hypothetical protein